MHLNFIEEKKKSLSLKEQLLEKTNNSFELNNQIKEELEVLRNENKILKEKNEEILKNDLENKNLFEDLNKQLELLNSENLKLKEENVLSLADFDKLNEKFQELVNELVDAKRTISIFKYDKSVNEQRFKEEFEMIQNVAKFQTEQVDLNIAKYETINIENENLLRKIERLTSEIFEKNKIKSFEIQIKEVIF
uniref:Uncharacterized protein n=1 Tax=Meloidogyne hapla TaxID=6305 RepID=A0A1I8B050_MELHA